MACGGKRGKADLGESQMNRDLTSKMDNVRKTDYMYHGRSSYSSTDMRIVRCLQHATLLSSLLLCVTGVNINLVFST